MSATRGQADPDRPDLDFYETPAWCTRAVCRWLKARLFERSEPFARPATILDPGAGSGAITRILRAEWPEARIDALELGLGHLAELSGTCPNGEVLVEDFLKWRPREMYDLLVCNPPYSNKQREDVAFEFVFHGFGLARIAFFLLRLNWLAGYKRVVTRHRFLRMNPPVVLVFAKRPSFRHHGTDATEYAWMGWGTDRGGTLEILPAPGDRDWGG